MSVVQWVGSSADWLTAADWSGGAVPLATDDVQIEVPDITVTVSTGTLAAASLTTVGSTLSVAGGTLSCLGAASIGGSYAQSGGVLALSAGAVFNNAVSLASGLIETTNGVFTSNDSYAQSGGTLALIGQGAVFHGAVDQTGGTIALELGALYSYGSFLEDGGALSLGFAGGLFSALTIAAGTVSSTAAVLDVGSAFVQTGGTLSSLGRDVTLAGTFSQSAGGTIDLLSGALELEGTGTLAGTVAGNGTLLVQSGTTTLASGVVISTPKVEMTGGKLVLGEALAVKSLFFDTGASVVALNGQTLTLNGTAELDGEIGGAGELVVAGGGQIDGLALDGTVLADLTSSVNQTGAMTLGLSSGSRAELDIAKTGRLRIAGNFTTTDASGNGLISNTGTIAKSGGSGVAGIYTNVVTTGTVNVAVGTLAFGGPTGSFGGVISGPGTFALTGGQNSFAKSLTLSVGHFVMDQAQAAEQLTLTASHAYAGIYSQTAGTLWLKGAGVTLTMSGQVGLDGGLITGTGTFATGAASHVNASGVDIEGTATLDIGGLVNQTTSVTVGGQYGAQASLVIASGATWKIENNASLGGLAGNPPYDNGSIVNDGVLEKLNGNANSNIVGTLTNAGTLLVGNSTLTLYGYGTLGGTVGGGGSLELQGTYTTGPSLALSVGDLGIGASAVVTLGGALSDAHIWSQTGGTLLLGGNTLTLGGRVSLEGGTVSGPGTLLASGAVTLGDNFAVSLGTLTVAGGADQVGDITVGDYSVLLGGFPQPGTLPPSAATLRIAAGAIYALDDNVNIGSNGTLAVAGTLTALGGGSSSIGPSVIDNGVILANSAALRFLGPVSGSGSLVIGAGGSLDFVGTVAASNTVSFASGSGSLLIEDSAGGTLSAFAAQVAGFQSGDFIEFANISTALSADTLALNAAGTVATITDNRGDSASITFTTAQSSTSLSLGLGAHGDLALFHI